ncbi:MAG TPA: hypothetical protein VGO80_20050 [Solirubrobacteraceae bacterium]|nr:hypothetical protein [Solirubrobacteraceae bacterium]
MRRCGLSLILVGALLLAGCGDDGPKVASKADFIAAADRICVQRDARGRRLARESGTDVGRLSGKLAEAYADAIAQVEALDLPAGAARAGAQRYVRSVVAMRRPVARMRAAAAQVAKAADLSALKAASAQLQIAVSTVQASSDVADLNARTYGMKSCGQQQSLPRA